MADNGDNFGESINSGAHEQHPSFAYGLRGPECQFVREVVRVLQKRSTDDVREFLKTLDRLDAWFNANSKHDVLLGDGTTPLRWAGLSLVVRSQLETNGSDAARRNVREAKNCFDAAWAESAKLFGADWKPATATGGDAAKHADSGLFSRYENELEPWTPGSWMVWDALTQINRTNPPKYVERAPVLFGDGDGFVMKLVVEVLPGPAGLVTPNWWKIGLTAFPNEHKDLVTQQDVEHYFFGAVERAMTLAMSPHQPFRVRWHLESNEVEPWRMGLEGRSCEAAAASAVLGAFEQAEQAADSGGTSASSPNPVLDAVAAVSAVIGAPRAGRFLDTPLEPVSVETLGAKLAAARLHNIDAVVVSSRQAMDKVEVPNGLRLAKADSVGEALDELRGVNRAFDAIKAAIRRRFEEEWTEEPTPEAR